MNEQYNAAMVKMWESHERVLWQIGQDKLKQYTDLLEPAFRLEFAEGKSMSAIIDILMETLDSCCLRFEVGLKLTLEAVAIELMEHKDIHYIPI